MSLAACGSWWASDGTAAAEPSAWTLGVIGDQQMAVLERKGPDYLDRFSSQADWLCEHAERLNLRMVLQVGDIVERANALGEWRRAARVMAAFDKATNADGGIGIPWSVAYGNHEIIGLSTKATEDMAGPGPSAHYRRFFGSSAGAHRYANQPTFRGASDNDLNTWHLIRASHDPDARSYLMLNLEIDVPGQKQGTRFDAIEWAQQQIDAHPGMLTIITTHVFEGTKHGPPDHPYLAGFGHNSQLEIWDKLVKPNSQIIMVLSGHTSEETHQIRTNAAGQPVLQMVTDYNKWLGTAGDGYFRLVELDEPANKLRVQTYSALLDKHRTDRNGQFEMELDFEGRFPAAVPSP